MRDLALVAGILVCLGYTYVYPFAGMLTWEWLALMAPHQLVYGFALGKPFNLVVALATFGALFLAKEKPHWPKDILPKLMLVFLAWVTFNCFFAVDPPSSWELYDRTIKIYAFTFLCFAYANTKARIQALLWVMVVSIAFFGVKGGIFTIIKGGDYHVYGPPNTIIYDNNQLAVAIVMTLPLIHYLRQHTSLAWLRWGLLAAFVLQIFTVLGSYSRGGVVALTITLGYFWWNGKNRLRNLLVICAAGAAALSVMPPAFFARMATISNASNDSSFEGRVTAWQVAWDYARDHFPFGAGFAGPQRPEVFNYYFPGADYHAAHSIYFQVLGENGFPALALYILTMLFTFRNTRRIVTFCKDQPELAWARELAKMIEVSLVGFGIGGALLSMAYYDGLLILQPLTSTLRAMVENFVPTAQQLEAEAQPILPIGRRFEVAE